MYKIESFANVAKTRDWPKEYSVCHTVNFVLILNI